MTKIEELEEKLAELILQAEKMEEDILIQKAVEKLNVTDFKNNLIDDVRLVELDLRTSGVANAVRYVVSFKLNDKPIHVEIDVSNNDLIRSRVYDVLKENIFRVLYQILTTYK